MKGKLVLGCRCVDGHARGTAKVMLLLALVIAWGGGGLVEQAHASSTQPAKPQTSEMQAKAALVPLLAVMVCTRVCPA
jgi:hypothetical protein